MKFSLLLLASNVCAATACLTEKERNGGHIIDLTRLQQRQTAAAGNPNATIPISTTDRFGDGTIPPRGVGSQSSPDKSRIAPNTVMSLVEVKSALKALAAKFKEVEYFEAPHKTVENRTVFGISIGAKRSSGNAAAKRIAVKNSNVFLQAGIHARERGAPDHLIYFVADLLFARLENRGLTYSGMSYTAAEVRAALENGLVVLPVVNPDGVAFDQATNSCWRKNRNPASSTPGNPNSVGVDLNRNFDVMWNFTKHLAPGVNAASTDPSNEAFYGTGPFSEAETKNVRWVLDTFPRVGWFVDLHSVAGIVLHGWCHDSNQATDPTQSFRNAAYDGKRGRIPDTPGFKYQEYMARSDWDALSLTAFRMAGGMSNALAYQFPAFQAPTLYPATGCSTDHAYARHILSPGKAKVLGFGIEFGRWNEAEECGFYPSADIYAGNQIEVGAGLMELLLAASRA